jgi:hypothetical protein
MPTPRCQAQLNRFFVSILDDLILLTAQHMVDGTGKTDTEKTVRERD